jgi:hypothetical protein
LSFDKLVAEFSVHFSPPMSARTIREALRRAGVPECRPATQSRYGGQATLYFDREHAEKWLQAAINPTQKR